MSDIIKLLEELGQNAKLQLKDEVEKAIVESELAEEVKTALLTKDTVTLEKQLDVCPDIFCILFPAEDEESEDSPSEDEKEADSVTS